MRRPDPARFTGSPKPKADRLEMKGFSEAPLDLLSPIEENQQTSAIRTEERSSGQTDVRTYERKSERKKTRHAFDIFEDQLRALHRLQLEAVQAEERKPNLGEMVQNALDMYLEKRRYERTLVRTDEEPKVRTNERI